MRRIVALLAAGATLSAVQAKAQTPLAFVACPILRDTATVPCWLAEHQGELYALALREDVSPPSLGHQALIEGTPTDERRCGGKLLANLRISIRPERDLSCDTILPATNAFQIGDELLVARPGALAPAPVAAPAPPIPIGAPPPARNGSQRFEVFYDFDWQTAGRNVAVIQDAAAYIKANPKAEVHVTGFRASVRLAGGRVLSEEEGIGLRRARELVETLVTLGVERDAILIADNPEAELGDHTRRRAAIDVVLGGGSGDHSEH